METAGLGLNIFQVIQNELIQREGNRSTLGLGSRLSVLENRLKNQEARTKNGLVWRLHHTIAPIFASTPETRALVEAQRKRLLERKGAKPTKDEKDPTMHVRDDELWEVHRHFPRTVLEFKKLQFHPDWVRSLLEFYCVRVYRPDMRSVIIGPADRLVDIQHNLETCLEELATTWGLNWFQIGGLELPSPTHHFPNP
ncbi:uncharacterized protein Z519_06628 [Cladophialophora bantiana CBS 173.52]|uniref:Uncharacterized protein n=1 Tax=Cladophialophora bantiana (strain ATCC 10958 / CBS 173.52 / CDC B-1940 / NIH 8579) TaxID=1442370 RepID=A0A0D2I7H0_CLAB1|nr:uncharacterized protein Z519_06628 [Cladophialophora bantiana CBS 173.52]KIW92779.1 hypothetical protein Z519_06628 [Cladophialophora bantiana CBS 173.52]